MFLTYWILADTIKALITSKTAGKFVSPMLSSKFDYSFHMAADTKVFTLNAPNPWRLRARYLLVFVALISLSIHLSNLMANNDAKPVMWTPPVEPLGAVIVTRNTFTAPQPELTHAHPVEVAAVKDSVAGRSGATKTPVPAVDTLSEDLIAALERWSDAWSRQDMGAYLGAYAPSFEPSQGSSREAWVKQRTARITAKQNIRHEVRDVVVKLDQNKAVVKFTQVYADERLQQTDQKTMHWVLSDGRWLIAREVVL